LIGRLVGSVVSIDDSALTLDVGGVGYDLKVPAGTLGRATAAGADRRDPAGSDRILLWVETRQPRDKPPELFGFASQDERAMFRLLVTVQKVGPAVGLKILGALSPGEVAAAVINEDPRRLTVAPGVGLALAEEVVGKLKKKKAALPGLVPSPALQPNGDGKRLLGALTNLGFRPAEAERAVSALGERVGREPLPDLLKAALSTLA
jgi:Holliday junction DNA helicase RuvA